MGASESGEGGSLSGPLPISSSFRHSWLVDGTFPVSQWTSTSRSKFPLVPKDTSHTG